MLLEKVLYKYNPLAGVLQHHRNRSKMLGVVDFSATDSTKLKLALFGGLPECLGKVLYHFPGFLVKQRVMLHDQETVVVLHQDDHELKGCEDSAHLRKVKLWSNQLISNIFL
jgi:hypothetical protein